jgi:hypothetical protein
MKNKLFLFIISSLTIYSCKDSESLHPDDIYFKASAFIEVVDLAGLPVANVSISTLRTNDAGVFEKAYGSTNGDGILFLKNIYMFPSTYFTAYKPGFFEGSRRIYPFAGKTHFVRIILLNAEDVGGIQASTGGTINIHDQVTLNFPPDVFVKNDGQPYSGEVRINAAPIAADDEDLLDKMPGDLVGINNNGDEVALGSFGMAAIELRSPWNELLKLKEGKTVEMKMKVPGANLNHAPSAIPMWYFDETAGYWKEQGVGTLVGNEYVALLPHFSFWNCDDSFNAVKWGATFVYANGEPASQVDVTLTILSTGSISGGITNEDGFVSGLVPSNETLLVELTAPCGDNVYSEKVGPYATGVNIKSIVIPAGNIYLSKISGKAVNCSNEPLRNGFAYLAEGNSKYYVPLDERTGDFSLSLMTCIPSDISIKVVDLAAIKESQELTFPFDTLIKTGSIQVCKDWTEFIELQAVGRQEHFHFYQPYAYTGAGYIIMGALDSLQTQNCYFLVPAASAGTYPSDQSQVELIFSNGDRLFGTGIVVTFIEFGDLGGYLRGTISGTLHPDPGSYGGMNEVYPLVGSFTIFKQ